MTMIPWVRRQVVGSPAASTIITTLRTEAAGPELAVASEAVRGAEAKAAGGDRSVGRRSRREASPVMEPAR